MAAITVTSVESTCYANETVFLHFYQTLILPIHTKLVLFDVGQTRGRLELEIEKKCEIQNETAKPEI